MMVLLLLLLLLLLSLSSSLNLVQPPRRAVVVADNNNNNNAVGTAATNNNNNNNDHLSHNHQHQKSPSSSPSSSGTAAAASAASASASAAALAVVPQKVVALSPFENWCVNSMEKYYQNALSIKCPFFKRRATDVLDYIDQLLRFVVIRHKSLAILPPPPGWTMSSSSSSSSSTTAAAAAASSATKWRHLSLQQVCDIVRKDWKQDSNRGYYITGRPTVAIYRDDCFFDGPDPDMPVRGLRKYLNAASQLFDQSQSRAELISLETMENNDNSNSNSSTNNKSPGIIVAKWRMNGILRLPWRPELPEWTGTTTYHCDEQGLIYLHEETWDMSVAQAFLKTLWPQLAHLIWQEKQQQQQQCDEEDNNDADKKVIRI